MSVEQMLRQLLKTGWSIVLTGVGDKDTEAWHLRLTNDQRDLEYKGFDLYSVVRAAHDGNPEGLIT